MMASWVGAFSRLGPGGLGAASAGQTVLIWDVNTGKEIASVDLGTAADVAKCVALTPDGRAFLTGTANWLVLRFDVVGAK